MDIPPPDSGPRKRTRDASSSLSFHTTQTRPNAIIPIQEVPDVVRHVAVGVDQGFEYMKVAYGVYAEDDDTESIEWAKVYDITNFPGTPDLSFSRQTPTESSYPTSDDESQEILHGWLAR